MPTTYINCCPSPNENFNLFCVIVRKINILIIFFCYFQKCRDWKSPRCWPTATTTRPTWTTCSSCSFRIRPRPILPSCRPPCPTICPGTTDRSSRTKACPPWKRSQGIYLIVNRKWIPGVRDLSCTSSCRLKTITTWLLLASKVSNRTISLLSSVWGRRKFRCVIPQFALF